MKSKYMTLEKYAATLKVGDEVTIEYHSMAGDRQTIILNSRILARSVGSVSTVACTSSPMEGWLTQM